MTIVVYWIDKCQMMKRKQYQPIDSQKISIVREGSPALAIAIPSSFGFFIKEAAGALSYTDLNRVIGMNGLRYKSVRALMTFLELTTKGIALLTGVSARTVSRWSDDSTIGVLPSKNLVKVDAVVQKGIDVFGSKELFKAWLNQSNMALGDETPLSLLTTPYGVELVEDAIEALAQGSVL
jgi:putative toxin-antitoxin system antitoxin component (TIGR02293 family)